MRIHTGAILGCALLLLIQLVQLSKSKPGTQSNLLNKECSRSLGMETGDIKDSDISASSYFDYHSVGPHNARVRQDIRGGAWCPRSVIQVGVEEWLEVNLHTEHWITGAETQGRFGGGQGQEFTEQYQIQYWRESIGDWVTYRNHSGHGLLQGNENTYITNYEDLDPSPVASKVRFLPYSSHPRTVCMRVEVYGCLYTNPVLTYSAPPGDEFSPGVYLEDVYDGQIQDGGARQNGGAKQGLGVLTDGRIGRNLSYTDQGLNSAPGWVGWRNKKNPLQLEFKLKTRMMISGVTVSCYHKPDMGIQVFKQIQIRVGNGSGKPQLVILSSSSDTVVPGLNNLQLKVPNITAEQFVLSIEFKDKWILISEINFSTIPSGEIKNFAEPETKTMKPKPNPNPTYEVEPEPDSGSGDVSEEGEKSPEVLKDIEDPNQDMPDSHKPEEREKNSFPEKMNDKSETYIGVVIGILSVTVLLLLSAILLILRKNRQKIFSKHSMLKTHMEKKNGNLTMKEMRLRLSPLKSTSHSLQGPFGHLEESDTEDGSMYQEPFRLVDPNPEFRKLVKNYSCGRLCDYDDFGSLNPGASNKFGSTPLFNLQTNDRMRKPTTSKSFTNNLYEKDYRKPSFDPGYSVPISKSRHSLAPALSVPAPEETFYAATDIIKETRRRDCRTNSLTCMLLPQGPLNQWKDGSDPWISQPSPPDRPIPDLSRKNLRLLKKLGEGKFGLVHLCELDRPGFLGSGNRKTVIVKSLWKNSSKLERDGFLSAGRLLGKLSHPNLSLVVGFSRQDDPYCILSEYLEYGDLYQFYQTNNTFLSAEDALEFRMKTLVQICSGMVYLDGLGCVHRDLATRNCLVGSDYRIKVSDLGIFQPLYAACYYTCTEDRIPLRWMPWEAVTMDEWSSASDVWAFGVVIWEILTDCRTLPFSILSDIQLEETIRERVQVLPSSPEDWEDRDGLVEIMFQCWSREPRHRPSFSSILQQINRLS